jgi:hypothetical protein
MHVCFGLQSADHFVLQGPFSLTAALPAKENLLHWMSQIHQICVSYMDLVMTQLPKCAACQV